MSQYRGYGASQSNVTKRARTVIAVAVGGVLFIGGLNIGVTLGRSSQLRAASERRTASEALADAQNNQSADNGFSPWLERLKNLVVLAPLSNGVANEVVPAPEAIAEVLAPTEDDAQGTAAAASVEGDSLFEDANVDVATAGAGELTAAQLPAPDGNGQIAENQEQQEGFLLDSEGAEQTAQENGDAAAGDDETTEADAAAGGEEQGDEGAAEAVAEAAAVVSKDNTDAIFGNGAEGLLHGKQVAEAKRKMGKRLKEQKTDRFRAYCVSLIQAYVAWHRAKGLSPTLAELLALPSSSSKAAVEKAPRGQAGVPTVTVILNVFKREVLREQLAALLTQSAANRIREIWVCVFSAPAEQFSLRVVKEAAAAGFKHIRVVSSDFNFKFYGRFQVALTAPSDFVYLLDDDMIPGRQHLANLLHASGTELLGRNILGSIGRVLPRPHKDMSLDSYRLWGRYGGLYFPDYYFDLESAVPVDYLCSQWFLKPEWLHHMWSERPQTFETGEDFHVSHTLRKYGNIGTYIMPYDPKDPETKGSTDRGLSFVAAATGRSDVPLRDRIWRNALKAGSRMRWSDMLGPYDAHVKPSMLLIVASPMDAMAMAPFVESLRRSLVFATSDDAWKPFIFSPLLGCRELAQLWRLDAKTYCSAKYMRVFAPLTSDPAIAGTFWGPRGTALEIKSDPNAPPDGWSHMAGLALRNPEEWEVKVSTSLRMVLHSIHARWVVTPARALAGGDEQIATATPVEVGLSRAVATAIAAHNGGLGRALPTAVLQIPREDVGAAPWAAGLLPDMAAAWQIPRVGIHVITNDRLASLQRLCASLEKAHYLGDRVALHFHVDVDADAALAAFILAMKWPHGPKHVHRRVRRGGLISAVTESFHPSSPHEYAVLLEDDIEVSPLFYSWLKNMLLRYRYASAGPDGKYGYPDVLSPTAKPINALAGISLYTPRLEEVTSTRLHLDMAKASRGWGAVLFPTPSSWGALYFPEAWQALHAALVQNKYRQMPSNIRVNGWSDSWKKYMFSLMYHNKWTFLYPGYANETSFATNHMEAGVHIGKPSKIVHRREDYVVPLFKDDDAFKIWSPNTLRLPPLDKLGSVSLVGKPEREAAAPPVDARIK